MFSVENACRTGMLLSWPWFWIFLFVCIFIVQIFLSWILLWYAEKFIVSVYIYIYITISKRNKIPGGSSSEDFVGNFQDWKGSPNQHFLKCSVGSNLGKTIPRPNASGVICSPLFEIIMPNKGSGTLCRKWNKTRHSILPQSPPLGWRFFFSHLSSFDSVFLNIFDLSLLFCMLTFQHDWYFVKYISWKHPEKSAIKTVFEAFGAQDEPSRAEVNQIVMLLSSLGSRWAPVKEDIRACLQRDRKA